MDRLLYKAIHSFYRASLSHAGTLDALDVTALDELYIDVTEMAVESLYTLKHNLEFALELLLYSFIDY